MPPNDPTTSGQPIQSSERSWLPVLTSKNLSIIVTGIVLFYAIYKADPKDIPKIVATLVTSNVSAAVGWTLAVVFLLVAAVLIKLLTRFYDQEMNRLAKERDELQRLLIGRPKN